MLELTALYCHKVYLVRSHVCFFPPQTCWWKVPLNVVFSKPNLWWCLMSFFGSKHCLGKIRWILPLKTLSKVWFVPVFSNIFNFLYPVMQCSYLHASWWTGSHVEKCTHSFWSARHSDCCMWQMFFFCFVLLLSVFNPFQEMSQSWTVKTLSHERYYRQKVFNCFSSHIYI